jgi:hypothetical protein
METNGTLFVLTNIKIQPIVIIIFSFSLLHESWKPYAHYPLSSSIARNSYPKWYHNNEPLGQWIGSCIKCKNFIDFYSKVKKPTQKNC